MKLWFRAFDAPKKNFSLWAVNGQMTMTDALPLFCKSILGGECDLCCFLYTYSQRWCSLLEALLFKLVHFFEEGTDTAKAKARFWKLEQI